MLIAPLPIGLFSVCLVSALSHGSVSLGLGIAGWCSHFAADTGYHHCFPSFFPCGWFARFESGKPNLLHGEKVNTACRILLRRCGRGVAAIANDRARLALLVALMVGELGKHRYRIMVLFSMLWEIGRSRHNYWRVLVWVSRLVRLAGAGRIRSSGRFDGWDLCLIGRADWSRHCRCHSFPIVYYFIPF